MVPGSDCRLGALFHVHDLGGLESGLELADAGFHLPLGVLGGVVVAVLGQVAERPCGFDRTRYLHPAPGGQVLELGLEALIGGRRELRGELAGSLDTVRLLGAPGPPTWISAGACVSWPPLSRPLAASWLDSDPAPARQLQVMTQIVRTDAH